MFSDAIQCFLKQRTSSTQNCCPQYLICFFFCLQKENPKILPKLSLFCLKHTKKIRNIQRCCFPIRPDLQEKQESPAWSLQEEVIWWLKAPRVFVWLGAAFCSVQALRLAEDLSRCGRSSSAQGTAGSTGTCLLPWLLQQVGRGACQGPICCSRLALSPKGRQARP